MRENRGCGKSVSLLARGWEIIGKKTHHPCGTTLYDSTPIYCDECEQMLHKQVVFTEDCVDLMAFCPATAKKGTVGEVTKIIDEKVVNVLVKDFQLFEGSSEKFDWNFAVFKKYLTVL